MRIKTIATGLAAAVVMIGLASLDADAAQRGKAKGKTKNAPAHCRSGAGHPVFGRQWCLERGYGLGETGWRKVHLGKVVFKRTPTGRSDSVHLGYRDIAEILTDIVLDEIFGRSHNDLDRSGLSGAWRGGTDDGILVLEVLVGGAPIAELTDTDLDGEVDVVLLSRH